MSAFDETRLDPAALRHRAAALRDMADDLDRLARHLTDFPPSATDR